ncbi:transmembrane amino acid transporter protein-domain-containing protein [Choanephora cucurbitarum]|nr:transmembrane amino acid transporter protein-domain-containing protein [Choanephora cucurbitarum]
MPQEEKVIVKYKSTTTDSHESALTENDFRYEDSGFIDVDRTNGYSSLVAFFNVFCIIAGTGILGLPYALRQGGFIGVLIFFLSWSMSIYAANILIRCLYANGRARLTTYKDVAEAAFGCLGGWIAFFFNTWMLIGIPVLYLLLSGTNINTLCQGTSAELGLKLWIVICCALVGTPFVLAKSLKETAWMSVLSTFTILVVVIIVLIMCGIDSPNHPGAHHDIVIWQMFPISLSTISFSFGGNTVYARVEASMKRPQDWAKVTASSLSTCAALYLSVAIAGYIVYGDQVTNPVYFSIPSGAPRTIAIVLITVHCLTTAPIMVTSFSIDLEEMFDISVKRYGKVRECVIRIIMRVTIMVVIALIACFLPHFSALMSLIGAFGNCTLVFMFPVLMYLRLTGFRNKPFYELIWCFFVVLLGVIGLIFGSIDAIRELKASY